VKTSSVEASMQRVVPTATSSSACPSLTYRVLRLSAEPGPPQGDARRACCGQHSRVWRLLPGPGSPHEEAGARPLQRPGR
jgi:hypothetical protein